MHKPLHISIIQPSITACHENWNNMTPHEKGKFCQSCSKVVHDLSSYTTKQLENFLLENSGDQICARVPYAFTEHPFSFSTKKEAPRLAWFALVIFIVFGMTLFSCHEKEYEAVKSSLHNSLQYSNVRENFMTETDIRTATEQEQKNVTDLTFQQEILPAIDMREQIPSKISDDIVWRDTLETVVIRGDYESIHTLGGMVSTVCLTTTYTENETTETAQKKEEKSESIAENSLMAFPNPARNNISIKYMIAEDGLVVLSLYSMNGQKIADLRSESRGEAGEYTEQFNTANLPAGQYIILLFNNALKKDFRLTVVH